MPNISYLWAGNSTPRYIPNRNADKYLPNDMTNNAILTSFIISPKWKQSKYPTTVERIHMLYSYNEIQWTMRNETTTTLNKYNEFQRGDVTYKKPDTKW